MNCGHSLVISQYHLPISLVELCKLDVTTHVSLTLKAARVARLRRLSASEYIIPQSVPLTTTAKNGQPTLYMNLAPFSGFIVACQLHELKAFRNSIGLSEFSTQ